MTVTLGFDVEEFDFPLERGRSIDLQTQLAVSSAGLEALLQMLDRLDLRVTILRRISPRIAPKRSGAWSQRVMK